MSDADKEKMNGVILNKERRDQEEKRAAWWLDSAPGLGAVRLLQLAQLFGSAVNIAAAARERGDGLLFWQEQIQGRWKEDTELKVTAANWQSLRAHLRNWEKAAEEYHRWTQAGIRFITIWDDAYPERLSHYRDRPFALYVKGNLPLEERKTAAVIGARACSRYGRIYARKIARELAERQVQIVSGLAAGIDSEGHVGALDSGMPGATYAVLGCGPEQCYPREHGLLADRIVEAGGGLISEFAPGTPPLAHHFPMRNRIISGLSDCILVMEARGRSGSLITVGQALEQGKEVFALPGRANDGLSEGCNCLIKTGAALLTGSREVLEYLLPGAKENNREKEEEKEKSAEFVKKPLAPNENLVYSCLDCQGKSVEQLMELTGLPLSAVREELLLLLLDGEIAETAKGCYAALE